MKAFKLLAPDGSINMSEVKGTLGGNRKDRIYGELTCSSANRHLPTYARIRVFFADEAAAIAAGYRPCWVCSRLRYNQWKQGGIAGSPDFSWLVLSTNVG